MVFPPPYQVRCCLFYCHSGKRECRVIQGSQGPRGDSTRGVEESCYGSCLLVQATWVLVVVHKLAHILLFLSWVSYAGAFGMVPNLFFWVNDTELAPISQISLIQVG